MFVAMAFSLFIEIIPIPYLRSIVYLTLSYAPFLEKSPLSDSCGRFQV
jgi:hypothetical protein